LVKHCAMPFIGPTLVLASIGAAVVMGIGVNKELF
jgi:hypothetical protein